MRVLAFIAQRSFARYVMIDLADAARRIGWDVQWLDLESAMAVHAAHAAEDRRRLVGRILLDVERANPDLVFGYGLEYLERVFAEFAPGVEQRLFELVQRPGVSFFFDFGYPFDRPLDSSTVEYLVPLQGPYHFICCWDRDAIRTLHEYGLRKVRFFPMAVNDAVFHPPDDDAERTLPLIFIGGPTDERIRALEAVADLGLRIHGYDATGWRASAAVTSCYDGELLERAAVRDAYGRARISINVTRPHGASSLNMRVYEAMACGSLMLTDDKSDVRQLFREGEEIVVFRDVRELRALAEHYLAHEDERRAIARAGMQAVLTRHTYAARLQGILSSVADFQRDASCFATVDQKATTDPEQAVASLRDARAAGALVENADNLCVIEARLQLALGDRIGARASLVEALRINPQHLIAKMMLAELDQP